MAKAKKKKKSGHRPKVRITAYREAYRQLVDYAAKPENRRMVRAAQARFLGIAGAPKLTRHLHPYFLEWLLADYRESDTGTILIERFVESRKQFDEPTRERILDLVREGIPGFFTVTLSKTDDRVVLQELGAETSGGYQLHVESSPAAEPGSIGSILEGRLAPWDDEWLFLSGYRQLFDPENRGLAVDLRQLRQKYDTDEWRVFMAHFKPRLWQAATERQDIHALIKSAAQTPKMTKEGLDVETIRLLFEKGETDRAIRMAEAALQKAPANREIALLLARAYMENTRFSEAIKVFEPIVETDPDSVAHRFQLAELHASLDQWDEAKQVLEPALKFSEHPLASEVRCAYGDYLYRSGDRERGRHLMLREIENSPGDGPLLNRVTYALSEAEERGRLKETLLRCKEKTAELSPFASLILGRCYYLDGQWQEALDALDKVPNLSRAPAALRMMADSAFELGRYTRARQAYSELIRDQTEMEPREAALIHFKLAYLEWQRGMHERAMPHLRQAYEADPRDPNTLWLTAEIYLSRREIDRATAVAVALYEICPDHPGIGSLFARLFPELLRGERRKPRYGAGRPRRRFRCRARKT